MNSSYMYCNTYFSLIGTELLLLHNKLLCVVLSQLIYFFQMFIKRKFYTRGRPVLLFLPVLEFSTIYEG